MPPRSSALPQANTESARKARQAFFCELCNKGYARQNEFEAHESSYDHQHRKRLRDMRQLVKDPNAEKKARAADRKAIEQAGLIPLDNAASAQTKKKSAPAAEPHPYEDDSDVPVDDKNGDSDELGDDDYEWTPQQRAQWDRMQELCDEEGKPLDQNDPFFAKRDGWEQDLYRSDVMQLSEYDPLTGERREGPTIITIPKEVAWTDEDDEEFMNENGWENWYDIKTRKSRR